MPWRRASTILVERARRLRADAFGVKPTSAIALNTAERVDSVTRSGLPSARLTVAVDTPARRATSRIVTDCRVAGVAPSLDFLGMINDVKSETLPNIGIDFAPTSNKLPGM